MENNSFCKGERVVLICDNPDGSPTLKAGIGGVIRGDYSGSYAVEYDVTGDELHSCGGICADGHGWFTPKECLAREVLDDTEMEAPVDGRDIISFLGIS